MDTSLKWRCTSTHTLTRSDEYPHPLTHPSIHTHIYPLSWVWVWVLCKSNKDTSMGVEWVRISPLSLELSPILTLSRCVSLKWKTVIGNVIFNFNLRRYGLHIENDHHKRKIVIKLHFSFFRNFSKLWLLDNSSAILYLSKDISYVPLIIEGIKIVNVRSY